MLIEGQEILEGRFKIIKKLGSGAFGEIFKGTRNLLQFYKKSWEINHMFVSVVEKKKTGEFFAAKIVSFSWLLQYHYKV